VAKFGNYNATYGSLGAVVVMLTWLYLSSYVLLFGAEFNSELEHQTAADTTDGPAKPLGDRGAWAADQVADGVETGEGASAPDKAVAGSRGGSPEEETPSMPAEIVTARVGARLAHLVGLKKVGMISSGIATIGLALLRKPGRAAPGAALIATAAVAAWLTRQDDRGDA
jgi:hypothetical protein